MPEYLKSRRGHALNLNLLSPVEIKQIKRDRALQPQEFVLSEADDFVFLVRDASGKRNEARVAKNALLGEFQGLYKAADGTLLVLRSQLEEETNKKLSIRAFTAQVRDGTVAEKTPPDASFITYLTGQVSTEDYAEVHHRWVGTKLRKLGVGSEILNKVEKSCSSMGFRLLKFFWMMEGGKPTQEDVHEMLVKRGYEVEGEGPAEDLVKRLPRASIDDNMSAYYKFPINPSGPRRYYSEPIKHNP